jgi:tetratricopeptide (TPR) repeat protein
MKSQLRCILFALIALPACGGDRSAGKPSAVVPELVAAPANAAPAPAPAPVAAAPALAPAAAPVALPPVAPTTYADALAQAKAAVAANDAVRARTLFEAASKFDRKAAEPHIELARLFIAGGERGRAIAAAHKAVKLAPDSSLAFNTLGRAELLRFGYDDAIAAFKRATELNPDNVWAWNNLGLAELQQKHYDEAVAALVEATSRKGNEGYMWNNLGTAYEQLGELDDARTAFEAGGRLGSREAVASRKRLEGVHAVVVKADPAAARPASGGYELSEPMPRAPGDTDAGELTNEAGAPDEAAQPAAGPAEATPASAKPSAEKPDMKSTAPSERVADPTSL